MCVFGPHIVWQERLWERRQTHRDNKEFFSSFWCTVYLHMDSSLQRSIVRTRTVEDSVRLVLDASGQEARLRKVDQVAQATTQMTLEQLQAFHL